MEKLDKRIVKIEMEEIIEVLSKHVRERGSPTTEPTGNPYLTIWDSLYQIDINDAMDQLVSLGAAEYVCAKNKGRFLGRERSIRFVKREEGGE